MYIKKTNNPKMGRPSSGKDHFVSFRLTAEMDEMLEQYASEMNMSKSQVIQLAIRRFFE